MSDANDSSKKEESLLRALDHYWFGHGSPTAIGIFRISMGALALINFFFLALHWDSWFSETGYVPAWLSQQALAPRVPLWNSPDAWMVPRIDLISGVTDARITLAFFGLGFVAALTTMLGLWTRISTIILALVLISISHRNSLILHGGDTVLRISCIYLAFAPSGLSCSLDRLIGLWRGKVAPTPVSVSLWTQRLICYNMALIYFTTVWQKMDGNLWRTGLATWFPARLAEFYRFPVPAFINQPPFVQITTYGTLLTEFALATLVFFRPCRKYVLLAGLMMHAFIEYSMNIPLFSYLITSMYVCFYDGEEISAWAERTGHRLRKFQVTVRFPRGKQLRPTASAFLDAADPFKLVTYAPASQDAWEAARSDGRPISPTLACRSRIVGSYAFGWIPGTWKRILGNSVEDAPEPVEPAPEAPAKRPRSKR